MSGPAWFSGTLNLAKNEDWKVALTYMIDYTVSGDPENIQPLDLEGSQFLLQIRKTEEDASAIVSISTDDGGIVITNAAAGEFELTITTTRSQRLHPGDYVADLLRTDQNGFVERVLEVACIVVEGTSREGVVSEPHTMSPRAAAVRRPTR
jgi:hypothetical protein